MPGMSWNSNSLLAQSPVGGQIVAGVGTIDSSLSDRTNITTTTDRAVINWNDFSVGAGHTVNFDQLNSTSAVLNRVVGNAPQSLINGAITSNGNVFVSNPSGVVIGSTGVINTNGFTATTLDISNERFMNGDLTFSGQSAASIVNNGHINTGDGGAHLIASQVFNNGTIETTGVINLATGGQLKMSGGRYIQADLETISNGISGGSSLIKNSGDMRAIGGLEVGGEVYLVNPNGAIVNDANIVAALKNPDGSQAGGHVEMIASGNTTLSGASVDVSGATGGSVIATGDSVSILASEIDASGEHGGGNVRIGGGWQGKDAQVANAVNTTVSADSTISVDSTLDGDAGTAVVWADQKTEFAGQINARALGDGDGGQAEVSGKQDLLFTGNVALLASNPEYQHGSLLLDPATFTLDAANQDAIRAQWGSGNLTIVAQDTISIDVDLFPTDSPGGDEKFSTDGSKTLLTIQEEGGGDGAVDIIIGGEIRDRRTGSAAVNINAGTGSVTVTATGKIDSSLGGLSDVTVYANTLDVVGDATFDVLVATGNQTVGLGDNATGVLNLSDNTLANVSIGEIQGSDFDLDMLSTGRARSAIRVVGDNVNIDRFNGQALDIESDDLTITGPIDGSGRFRFIGQANQTIGLGSGAGSLQFSKSILAGITGFSQFEMGHNTTSGSDISIVDAGLNFNSVTLRGSSIDIDRLSIGESLSLYTDSLNVQNALTKTSNAGTLYLQSMSNTRTVGLGDGTAGLLNVTADEFDFLGQYNAFDVLVGSGVITVSEDFTGNYSSRIKLNNSNGLIHLDGVSLDSNLFQLFSNDIQITNAVMGDIDTTDLDFNAGVNRMAVGSASPGDWTIDNSEFALLSGFETLTLHNEQLNGIMDIAGAGPGNNLDFSSITSGTVNFLSDSLRLADVSVPEALNLTVFSGLAFDGEVTTDDNTKTLKITAGHAAINQSGSTTLGLGTGTAGAVQLDDSELARIQQFATLHAKHVSAISPGTTQVNATMDRNLILEGGQQTDIQSLTLTGGSDLDVSTTFVSGGTGNPGNDRIIMGNVTTDGDITLDSSRLEVNGDVHTVSGDVSVDTQVTTVGNGSQTSHVGIGTANGTTTIDTGTLNVNASNLAGAQIGYAFTGTETQTASGDITIETTGDINLTGQGAFFAAIGHGDDLGGDDTGKTVSGDVTVSGGKNVTLQKAHVGHLVDPSGTYASGSTSVFAGIADFNEDNENRTGGDFHQPYSLNIDSQSILVSADFSDDGQLSLYAPSLSSYNLDPSALLNGGNATGSPPTNFAGPSDPANEFFGDYVGTLSNNWSLYSAPIGLDVQIIDATSVYGAVITSPATVDLLSNPSVLFGATSVGDLGLQVDYSNIDEQTDAGTYTLQVDGDNLKSGYFVRKVYRNGETYGTGPGVLITNYGRHIITPATLNISVSNQTKTFGDLFTWTGNEFVATGLVNNQTIDNLLMTSTGAVATATVAGGPYTIIGSTPTGANFNALNYSISIFDGSMNVIPAPLDVYLLTSSKLVGTEGESVTSDFVIVGLKNGDLINEISVLSEGLPSSAIVGSYSMSIDTLFGVGYDATNYAINLVNPVYTVYVPNDETVNDLWTRYNNALMTLPRMLSGGGGAVQVSVGGRSSVEITDRKRRDDGNDDDESNDSDS